MFRRVAVVAAAVAAMALMGAAPGLATPAQNEPARPADFEIQSTVYISGQDVVLGSCKAWMNRRTTDDYVQGLVQSWGDDCFMVLQRKRIGSYDWTDVSYYYEVVNASASTGFHWNGTDAGSRVCLENYSRGTAACGPGYW